jgi:signal transduction histidine kinase
MEMRPNRKPEASDDSLQLKAVIDAMADPIIVVRPDYRVVLVNETARRLFRDSAGGAAPLLCHQVSHHSDEPCAGSDHPCPMKSARESGKPVKVLHEHYREDEKRFVEITASPLWGDDGSFGGVVESQRDVTDRVLAERQLSDYASRLEQSNRLKDLFIDIMRHDLMNPAWFVLTSASMALRKGTDGPLKGELQGITRVSRKIIDLIQNASTLARIEEGGELTFEELDLAEMMEGAIAEHEAAARERGVDLALKASGPVLVRANPLLGDVFSNLVSNAIKYGAEGSTVDIAIREEGSACRTSVADRGEGVPDEDKEDIFTRFTRKDKGGVKGSGLGLSIVRRVVTAHRGRVWVEDRPGGGSVFLVEIPR